VDGKTSILADLDNGSVNDAKGAWIYVMLERILGAKRFDEVMAQFAKRSQQEPMTVDQFIRLSGQASFLRPWIEARSAPSVSAIIDGSRAITKQSSPFVRSAAYR
jgi:aminopeptidase N